MSHRYHPRVIGTEPNDLCPCNSGRKYKKCCGQRGSKGPVGRVPTKEDPIRVITPRRANMAAFFMLSAMARECESNEKPPV